MTLRRGLLALALLVLVAAAYTAWRAWQAERELTRAQSSGEDLIAAVRDDDPAARDRALSGFLLSAKAAHDHTDGPWWGALTHVPVFGDDAEGVRALSASLDSVGRGVEPLVGVVDDLDSVSSADRVDVDKVRSLQDPVAQANDSFTAGYREIAGLDSSGYVGPLKTRFDHYEDRLGDLQRALASADTAVDVLPGFLGGDGPRNYLLVFQNNAEIRATGGIPGSWAELHAKNGKLEIVRQGTGAEFGRRDTPVLPLSDGELQVYSDLLGVYFQDSTFTPDFPRAAQLMSARWQEKYDGHLDGVISLDPVALSYLLKGTGPVKVDDVTLTSSNAVEQLLSRPYLELDPADQDAFFATAAKDIFTAATGKLASPLDFVRGLDRAADEDRFLVAPFTPDETSSLQGSRVEGAVPEKDKANPHVLIGLSDATASKMSYYLRYHADVDSQSCSDGVQTLQGTMSLRQTITSAQAQALPDSVTGLGEYGTPKGSQLVAIRVYGPTGGDIDNIKVDGSAVDVAPVDLDGRPVVTLVALLSGPDDVLVTWSMASGPDQTGDGSLTVTPSVVPGDKSSKFESTC